ncbi:MAG: hypothetical protein IPI34_15175 [bacterium]|nr:hypothetical protein [bacterium]
MRDFARGSGWYDRNSSPWTTRPWPPSARTNPAWPSAIHHFADLRAQPPHTLPPSEEALLAAAGQMSRGASFDLRRPGQRRPGVPDDPRRRAGRSR